jgi:predicted nucleic acid-binding protein
MLITRNIFIDTSVFIAHNYSYGGSVFENMVRLSKSGQVKVFLTDITFQEIASHIASDVSKAYEASTKFRREARILRNLTEPDYTGLFREIDANAAIAALKSQLDSFLKNANVVIVPTSKVSVKTVFEKYFDRKAPFGDGKKKNEFPDAFALEALEGWCKTHGEQMYVASGDGDLRNYCSNSVNLTALEKLAEFISLVELHDETLAPAVNGLLERNEDAVENAITQQFENLGFWISDQDGDVNKITVQSVEVLNYLILEVDQNGAVVQVDARILFSADLTYDDMDTATYDSEDKVLIPWRTINKVVEQEAEIEVTLHIKHDAEEPTYFEIAKAEIDTPRGFDIAVSSDDEWPYK